MRPTDSAIVALLKKSTINVINSAVIPKIKKNESKTPIEQI